MTIVNGTDGINNNSLSDVIYALRQNIMKNLHVSEVCRVTEIKSASQIVASPVNNSSKKLFCYNLYQSSLHVGDTVLVVFSDTDTRINFNRMSKGANTQNVKDTTQYHSLEFGIVVGASSGGGSTIVLYDTTGQNTDGAMTQKAATDYFALKSSIGNGKITINRNNSLVGEFNTNDSANTTINIEVPTQASDVNALPNTTKYAASISLTISNNTLTAQLKDQDGNNIGSSQTASISVPNAFTDVSYNNTTKTLTFVYSDNTTKAVDISAIISGVEADIAAINALIPSTASSSNKLVDTNTMNSSIATNTATFRGTYNLITDLNLTLSATEAQIATALASQISTADANDYCYVQIPKDASEPTVIERYDRYKYETATNSWAFEFSLNNSSFTAAQWAAINSGLSSADKTKLDGIENGAEVNDVDDVQIDNISVVTNKIASIATKNANYDASTNKLVTENELADKIDKVNPAGTGSFSLNRHATATIGTRSVAIGYNAQATQQNSIAIGAASRCGSASAIAIGQDTTVASNALYAIALGHSCYAYAENSMALGYDSETQGNESLAWGRGTIANRLAQYVLGMYNILDTEGADGTVKGKYLEIIGNGTAPNARSNARTLDWSGNEEIAGNMSIKGGKISDGNNTNYALQIPDTTNWTADKTIATVDQIPSVPTLKTLDTTATTAQTTSASESLSGSGSIILHKVAKTGTLADLITDALHRTVSDSDISTWNAKQDAINAQNPLDYAYLTNTPTIPTVNNATITVTQGGVTKGTFTLNQSSNYTLALDGGGGGASIDVQVNSISIVAQNVANFITTSAYNASTNRFVMEQEIEDCVIHDDNASVSQTTLLDNYYTKIQTDNLLNAKSHFIELFKDTTTKITSASTYVAYTNLIMAKSYGDTFSFSNNAITVNADISYVKITMQCKFYIQNTGINRFGAEVHKNGTLVAYTNNYCDFYTEANESVSATFVVIVPVQNGDVIEFYGMSNKTNNELANNTRFIIEVL